MRYLFIQRHRSTWPVALLCRLLQVARSGYYAWQGRPVSPRKLREIELTVRIRAVHAQKHQDTYGSPRIHRELLAQGRACNRKTVARCMKLAGIRAITTRKYRVCTTDSKHPHPIASNVVARQFTPSRKNETWTADVTYIRTAEGWLYLAVVLDLYSRKVVGWSMSTRIDSRLVVDALTMGIKSEGLGADLVTHSDRGVQYASEHYQRLLTERNITCSMSRPGNCWDNAPTESFFATLKKELVYHEEYLTRDAARASLFEYIETFYNRIRRHSTLNYLSPCQFEAVNHTPLT